MKRSGDQGEDDNKSQRTKHCMDVSIVPVTSIINGVERCDEFPPVQFQFVYQSPPERLILHDRYNYNIFRRPYINGFAKHDRVLVVKGLHKGYTGMVTFAGDFNPEHGNLQIQVKFDHISDDDDEYGEMIPPDFCVIIPYPEHEKEQKIKYEDHGYMALKYENGVARLTMAV